MNRKAKGARAERRARAILGKKGYSLIVKAGASLGVFDLIAVGVEFDHALCIQVKTNRRPGLAEMDRIKAFQVPGFCRKQVWIFKDRVRDPEIFNL